jgi:hypothetical protein
MKRYGTTPRRSLLDRALGFAFIGFLLYVAWLSVNGQLWDEARRLTDWLGSFFS